MIEKALMQHGSDSVHRNPKGAEFTLHMLGFGISVGGGFSHLHLTEQLIDETHRLGQRGRVSADGPLTGHAVGNNSC
ncbi:MAG: hypothetical protein NXI17_06615 [Alphaproteobacteria bacterium]|nr:hypothetical protein [Alphaproteobacteria bacterium]